MKGMNSSKFLELLMTRNFSKIYVSEVSRCLLENERQYQGLIRYLESIPIEQPSIIPVWDQYGNKVFEVVVTLVPAGHCPGSVMFLFEGHKGTVLYTGDFRLQCGSTRRIGAFHHPDGRVKNISALYLDTTFCSEQALYIPSREHSMIALLSLIEPWLKLDNSNHVFFITPARIGYEAVFQEVYDKLGIKIHVPSCKYNMYKELPEILNVLTTDITCTRIHCCTRRSQRTRLKHQLLPCDGNLNITGSIRYIKLSCMKFTMYPSLDEIVVYDQRGKQFQVCFSTHSSLIELIDMVEYLEPKKIYPNVIADGLSPDQVLKPLLSALKHEVPQVTMPITIPPLGPLKSLRGGTSHSSEPTGAKDFVFSVPFSQENDGMPSASTSRDLPGERSNTSFSGIAHSPNKGKGISCSRAANKLCNIPSSETTEVLHNRSRSPNSESMKSPNKTTTNFVRWWIDVEEKYVPADGVRAPVERLAIPSSETSKSPGKTNNIPTSGTIRSLDKTGNTESKKSSDKRITFQSSEPVKSPNSDASSDVSDNYQVPLWYYPPLVIDDSGASNPLSSSAEQNSDTVLKEGCHQNSFHTSVDDPELFSNSGKPLPLATETRSPEKDFTESECDQKSSMPSSPVIVDVRSVLPVCFCPTICSTFDPASSTHELASPLKEESCILNFGSQIDSEQYNMTQNSEGIVLDNNSNFVVPSSSDKLSSESVTSSLTSAFNKHTSEATDINSSKVTTCAANSSSTLHLSRDEAPNAGKPIVKDEGLLQHQDAPSISQPLASGTPGSHVACQSLPSRQSSKLCALLAGSARGDIYNKRVSGMQKCGSDAGTDSSLIVHTDADSSYSPSLLGGNSFSLRNVANVSSERHDQRSSLSFNVKAADPSSCGSNISPCMFKSTPALSSDYQMKKTKNSVQDVNDTVSLEEQSGRDSCDSVSVASAICSMPVSKLFDHRPSHRSGHFQANEETVNRADDDYFFKEKWKTFSENSTSVSENLNYNLERSEHLTVVPISQQEIREDHKLHQSIDNLSPEERNVEDSGHCGPRSKYISHTPGSLPPSKLVFDNDPSNDYLSSLQNLQHCSLLQQNVEDKRTVAIQTDQSFIFQEKQAGQHVLGQDFASTDFSGNRRKREGPDMTSCTTHKKQKVSDSVSIKNSTAANYTPSGSSLSSPELFCTHDSSPEAEFPSIDNKATAKATPQNSPSSENVKQKVVSSDSYQKQLESTGTDLMSYYQDLARHPVSSVQNAVASAACPSLFVSESHLITGNKQCNGESLDLSSSRNSHQNSVVVCKQDPSVLESLESPDFRLFLSPSSDEQSFHSNVASSQGSLSVESETPSPTRNNSSFLYRSHEGTHSDDAESNVEGSPRSDATEEYNSSAMVMPEMGPLSENLPPMVTNHGILIIDEPQVVTVSSDDEDVTIDIILKSSDENVSSSPCSQSLISGPTRQRNKRVQFKPAAAVIDLCSDSE